MNEEELRAEVLRLTAELKTANVSCETLETVGQADKTRILELQEHNQKLFLQVLNKVEPTEEKEEEPTQSIEDFALTLKL